jgi:hypothetical protein
MSHTHKHELAHALRNGQPVDRHEPFRDERWGDGRHLRSRLKRQARREERHAWLNPLRHEEKASAHERQPRRPAFWRHAAMPSS